MIIAPKLKKGDQVRIVAPARSLGAVPEELRNFAADGLRGLGFEVTYSKNCFECDDLNSSSTDSRVSDLHDAFSDPSVKGIFAAIGGFNSNQLLRRLDYSLIQQNPKIFCGFSDVTALQNAIWAKAGLVTYSGPIFTYFGMKKGAEYIIDYFKKCCCSSEAFAIEDSTHWSDDRWHRNQEERTFLKNDGRFVINPGRANGTIIGGNLCTLNLLQGTEFMPSLEDCILFIEDDHESKITNFDRDLQSFLHLPDIAKLRGVVIGRFQKASEINREQLINAIKNKTELKSVPVVADLDFGHTTPIFTFPIGGQVELEASAERVELKVTRG